jgi:aspartate dehydrogenase
MKIAIIGCGVIGTVIAQAIKDGKIDAKLEYVYDKIEKKGISFAEKFQTEQKNFDEILKEDLDLIIEAASQEAVRILIPKVLEANKNVMIMSTGALVDENLLKEIKDLAKKNNLKVYLPSGAIVGLDGIKSAKILEINKVTLKTRKSPESLKDAPFFKNNPVDLDQIKNPTIIYEGPGKEAVKLFPANINVAASLSLAGIGPEKTKVQIIVDPNIKSNIHEITAEGSFGKITTKAENVPSPGNPRTSYLAALSAVATLKKITESIQVGT